MALPTVVPNVEVTLYGICPNYTGTWENLRAAGLTPPGYETAPERGRPGGWHWRDDQGRSWRMSSYGLRSENPRRYRAIPRMSKDEHRLSLQAARIQELDKCIQRLSQEKQESFRREALTMLNCAFKWLEEAMFRRFYFDNSPTTLSGTFAFEQSQNEVLASAYRTMRKLIEEGELDVDTTQLVAAKRLKASLEDRSFQGVLAKLSN